MARTNRADINAIVSFYTSCILFWFFFLECWFNLSLTVHILCWSLTLGADQAGGWVCGLIPRHHWDWSQTAQRDPLWHRLLHRPGKWEVIAFASVYNPQLCLLLLSRFEHVIMTIAHDEAFIMYSTECNPVFYYPSPCKKIQYSFKVCSARVQNTGFYKLLLY